MARRFGLTAEFQSSIRQEFGGDSERFETIEGNVCASMIVSQENAYVQRGPVEIVSDIAIPIRRPCHPAIAGLFWR